MACVHDSVTTQVDLYIARLVVCHSTINASSADCPTDSAVNWVWSVCRFVYALMVECSHAIQQIYLDRPPLVGCLCFHACSTCLRSCLNMDRFICFESLICYQYLVYLRFVRPLCSGDRLDLMSL